MWSQIAQARKEAKNNIHSSSHVYYEPSTISIRNFEVVFTDSAHEVVQKTELI